jgi:hypothetical protein
MAAASPAAVPRISLRREALLSSWSMAVLLSVSRMEDAAPHDGLMGATLLASAKRPPEGAGVL